MNRKQRRKDNVSGVFSSGPYEAAVAEQLISIQKSGRLHLLLPEFMRYCDRLNDYCYWYLLSTIWVIAGANADLDDWIRLFSSKRPHREQSMMKPDELKRFRRLPSTITAYRAMNLGETRWVSYTLSQQRALHLQRFRPGGEIKVFEIKHNRVFAFFNRRQEEEILVLGQEDAREIGYLNEKGHHL